jgi:hypothetical protein
MSESTPFNTYIEMIEYAKVAVRKAKRIVRDSTWGQAGDAQLDDDQKVATEALLKAVVEATRRKKRNTFKFQEVWTVPTEARLSRIKQLLQAGPPLPRYFAKYYPISSVGHPPLFSFLVIDDEEVLFGSHAGSNIGDDEWASTRDPLLVRYFVRYHKAVWEDPSARWLYDPTHLANLDPTLQEIAAQLAAAGPSSEIHFRGRKLPIKGSRERSIARLLFTTPGEWVSYADVFAAAFPGQPLELDGKKRMVAKQRAALQSRINRLRESLKDSNGNDSAHIEGDGLSQRYRVKPLSQSLTLTRTG